MGTLADAMNDATAAENAAVDALNAAAQLVRDRASQAQQIIQNFLARPLSVTYFVDPANGSDSNDGYTIGKPKKSIDNVLQNIGSQNISILLMGDDTIKLRHNVSTNVVIQGIQASNDPAGYTSVRRRVGFLGLALNSPSIFIGTYSAGMIFDAGRLMTFFIDWALPDVSPSLNTRAHIACSAFVDIIMLSPTITVSSQNAAHLFGSFNNGKLTVTIDPVLGSGAAGHLFQNVAAGADPNTSWLYSTNVKSA